MYTCNNWLGKGAQGDDGWRVEKHGLHKVNTKKEILIPTGGENLLTSCNNTRSY